MPKMNKKQFEAMFREEVLPYLIEQHEQDGIPDKPGRREAWNNTVDSYIRERQLPKTAGNWGHPSWLETWRPRGVRSHSTVKHRAHSTMKKSPAQLESEIKSHLAASSKSLYQELRAMGIPTDHHESDLYVLATPEARSLIAQHGKHFTAFTSEIDHQRWYEIPFAYDPFWEKKARR